MRQRDVIYSTEYLNWFLFFAVKFYFYTYSLKRTNTYAYTHIKWALQYCMSRTRRTFCQTHHYLLFVKRFWRQNRKQFTWLYRYNSEIGAFSEEMTQYDTNILYDAHCTVQVFVRIWYSLSVSRSLSLREFAWKLSAKLFRKF